eukprot:TRINITY_DN1731_c0_g1_i3.p1 TRINITY_DN1731_c0_g1~~TRINITY_DN1731_c0_g1_i3.p1  ORF type:complete len:217 (+),score=33.31 TRINITY_DN1731_c0_g1_i3:720-1370(+)
MKFKLKIKKMQNEVETTGTTIMALVYDGGVLIGADSRTTMGAYIASRASDKVEYLHDRIFCLKSGVASHTQMITKFARYNLQMHCAEIGRLPEVKTAAKLISQMQYDYKDSLLASMIIGGYDPLNGPKLYSLPPGGSVVETDYSLGGSGSGYIYGFVDANYRKNFSLEEAKQFLITAISLAMKRDGSSGGIVRIVKVTEGEVKREYFKYQDLPVQQ